MNESDYDISFDDIESDDVLDDPAEADHLKDAALSYDIAPITDAEIAAANHEYLNPEIENSGWIKTDPESLESLASELVEDHESYERSGGTGFATSNFERAAEAVAYQRSAAAAQRWIDTKKLDHGWTRFLARRRRAQRTPGRVRLDKINNKSWRLQDAGVPEEDAYEIACEWRRQRDLADFQAMAIKYVAFCHDVKEDSVRKRKLGKERAMKILLDDLLLMGTGDIPQGIEPLVQFLTVEMEKFIAGGAIVPALDVLQILREHDLI